MSIVSVRYRFRQRFHASASDAYRWCTDYRPSDGKIFSTKRRRTVRRIAEDAVVLTDTTIQDGRARSIRRLVRMDPERFSWTNTHLDGPFRHSQFWYRVVRDGPRSSHLEFEGLHLEEGPARPSAAHRSRRQREILAQDASEWRDYLAPALEADLKSDRSSR